MTQSIKTRKTIERLTEIAKNEPKTKTDESSSDKKSAQKEEEKK
jgi:hypothetical protein